MLGLETGTTRVLCRGRPLVKTMMVHMLFRLIIYTFIYQTDHLGW